MKLPPYEGAEPYSRIEICQDILRRAVIDTVNQQLEVYSSVREIESMCTVLDGVRESLATMALKVKRKERNEVRCYELNQHYFKNSSDIKFVAKERVAIMTEKKFAQLTEGTQRKNTNGKR